MNYQNIKIQLFWNIENTSFWNYDLLEKKFNEALRKSKPEQLKNYFLDWWFEKVFKYLIDFKRFFKDYFQEKNFQYNSYINLFNILYNERINFQEYSAEIRNEKFNEWLLEHIKLFWKLFFYLLNKNKITLSDEDVINFIIKIAFHDIWRIFSHEEYFHQDIEEYLWVYNSDSFWKKIECTYDDFLNNQSFQKLSKYSFFYTLLDICSKRDTSKIYSQFNLSKDEKILDKLNENYYLSLVVNDVIEDLRWISKDEYLKWLNNKYALIEMINKWFNTLWEFENYIKKWFEFYI